MRISGNFCTVIWFRKFCEKPRLAGSNASVSVSLSGKRVTPKRSASTELSFSTHVLLAAKIFGRRTRI